ncbi:hypothetical protein SRHO_G00080620 [Serrasalmus rhombeus]
MIRVKLKRRLKYKGHHQYQFVHPEKVKTGLTHLKEHKFYRDVEFNNDWINPLSKTPEAEKHDDAYEQYIDEENTENTCEDDSIDDALHDRQQHVGREAYRHFVAFVCFHFTTRIPNAFSSSDETEGLGQSTSIVGESVRSGRRRLF